MHVHDKLNSHRDLKLLPITVYNILFSYSTLNIFIYVYFSAPYISYIVLTSFQVFLVLTHEKLGITLQRSDKVKKTYQ
jgi:hypothetical protein